MNREEIIAAKLRVTTWTFAHSSGEPVIDTVFAKAVATCFKCNIFEVFPTQ